MFNWITGVIASFGYFGIAGLMLLENVFPPIPSELIMPLAGYMAAQGKFSLIGLIVAGTIGSVIGALLWYWIGLKIGIKRLCHLSSRHGRWIGITPRDITRTKKWFDKHGWAAVFFGRMLPGARTLISVPAGMARMPFLPFLAYTTVGSALWTALLTVAGYLLGKQYSEVASWVNPVSTGVIVILVLLYIYRVITWKPLEDPDESSGAMPSRES
ncbi:MULTISPECIES: DedA family protein [Thioclava]|uniref:Alkaline phosphatase n=1 Tax=Thioclava nitratireducens TaxID=1915078 RepID=A0ABM6ID86_9RHOB|nr:MULTISPECIES: DedA family protein [Thioclava]AQS46654.1 alkaline phosphatase [Thioclava nitratireducens]OWY02198.1 alkaline phosphatase [Thioclava sp. IC9]OWY02704.1 alkaline phosphatase [Thioclava sp. F1Mire-8]OWY13160.1 alkaline phosphatase [Thioclava sp. F34-6]OWY16558.1 alkaline phosphatase [Thioclava sp. JM3]